MDQQGIPQWDTIYPTKSILETDIKNQHLYEIETEDQIVGFIVINEDQSSEYNTVDWKFFGRVLTIHRLTIHPIYQHQKLASSLMDFAENKAAQDCYDTIRLDAFKQNPGAIIMYEHRGYRKAGMVRFRKGDFFCYEKQRVDVLGNCSFFVCYEFYFCFDILHREFF